MRISSALGVVLGLPWLASAAICNNNCGRAVAGTGRADPPWASRSSQCADFLSEYVTVTPGYVYSSLTFKPGIVLTHDRAVTVTASPIAGRNVHGARQVVSAPIITGTVPAYASSCDDVTAYWSACQCFSGIRPTTVTYLAPAPVVTVTREVTSSVSGTSSISSTSPVSSTSSEAPSATCTPTSVLLNPIRILTEGDDEFTNVTLPFPIKVFNSSGSNVFVSINGRLSLFSGSVTWTNAPLPDIGIPAVSVLPYFDDLLLNRTTDFVAYQVLDSPEGGRRVTFEWITGSWAIEDQYYHFTASFSEAFPGIINFVYYSTSEKGRGATIGAQSLIGSGFSFVHYSFNTPNAVPDGLSVRLDTTGAGSFSTFNLGGGVC